VKIAAEVWRHKEIATRAARMLRERFIGVWGKLNFFGVELSVFVFNFLFRMDC
jgi:hypothetical protein